MFLSTMTLISFSIMRSLFEEYEVGRVLSLLNFYIFFASFIFQWFVGLILEFYPTAGSSFSPHGYRVGLIVMVVINIIAVLWCFSKIRKQHIAK